MLLKVFLPVFIIILLFFTIVFQLMDISSNLWRYISHETSLLTIGRIAFYYLPKCVSFSLPMALLFSITFSMGNLYRNNELISIFGSGIKLFSFVMPLIMAGILLSAGGFFFEEKVVIPTFKTKNRLVQQALKQPVTYSNSNVTVKSSDNRFVYNVNYYNDKNQTLSGLMLLERDTSRRLVARIDAEYADWNGYNWVLHNCRIFSWDDDGMVEEERAIFDSDKLAEKPAIFRRVSTRVDEMEAGAAGDYIDNLKKAGLPYEEPLSEYYRKFSFALTPLIAALIASSIGGVLKKNVLLMSLFFALAIFVVYYVVQMVAMTLARNGYISPAFGAWSAFVLFILVAVSLFRLARS